MLDTDDVALWYALSRFTTRYWFDVDFNGGNDAHEFYLPEALFAVGENRFEGQEKIRAFYLKRQRRGVITGRHLINNLQVLPIDERQVRLDRGAQPVLRPRPPATSRHTPANAGRRHRG